MRNIFDQYSQPENRITHALVTALHEDQKLLRAFLKDIPECLLPRKKQPIEIFEQTYPGELEKTEDAKGAQGVPDGRKEIQLSNPDRRLVSIPHLQVDPIAQCP